MLLLPQTAALVLIDGSSEDLMFDYVVPDALIDKVLPGCRVRVTVRNRPTIGTVVEVREIDPDSLKFSLKPIVDLADPEPILTEPLLKLGRWMADYYLSPMDSVIRAMIPAAVRGGEGKGEKTRKAVGLNPHAEMPIEEAIAALLKRAPRQAEVLTQLIGVESKSVPLKDLVEVQGISRSSISALEKAGHVRVFDEVIERDPFAALSDGEDASEFVATSPLQLNEEQAAALTHIVSATEDEQPKPILLFGVTGSGKTEVYLQAIEAVLDAGKSAIVLVPEISLAPQTSERFKQRFSEIQDQVAILHSHLSEGERHDEWKKILRRQARIVIGARSAIFAPINNLGLIVVDEEHENSYKQETVPRYHGRDLAVVRAHLEKCPVILGSATPSLETWNNAENGKYDTVRLDQRVDDRALPLVRVVDMRLEGKKVKGQPNILSTHLRNAMENRLANGEQIILFLNRRGFARAIQCPECGEVVHCRHCSLPMTYHRVENRLICHMCGFASLAPRRCPACDSPAISLAGYGTEKVEEVLRKVFKTARIARVDADSMRKKNALRDTLNAFKAKKLDILLGTQMIAKGLHFPNVTLVGILNSDTGLHIPDPRAGERTFQLITQVAGRAGRGELEGEVIVQTFTPHHPAVQFGRHHDFEGFAEQEFSFRRRTKFPPFAHLAVLTIRCKHKERAEFSLQSTYRRLAANPPEGLTITEPLPSPLERSHDQWRFQCTMFAVNPRLIQKHVKWVLDSMTFPEDVIVTLDMDAYNLS